MLYKCHTIIDRLKYKDNLIIHEKINIIMVDKSIQAVGKITKFGNSKGIILDKRVMEYLDLKIGDFIQLTIEKLPEKKRNTESKQD